MKYIQTFRLYPTPEQAAKIRKRFALAGYAYNWGLQETERVWEAEKRHLSYYDIVDIYRHYVHYQLYRPFSREEHEALQHLDHAYSEYFEHLCEKPRAKQPEDMTSMTYRAENAQIDYERQTVLIGKAGRVRCNFYRHVQGSPTTATVKEVKPGVFNIVFLADVQEVKPRERNAEVVGIDLGIKCFATLSDGTAYDMPDRIWGPRAVRHEERLQRRMGRCKVGSKRHERARRQLAKFHEHKANQRKDFHYKTAADITARYKAVAVETLVIEEMKQKKRPMRRSMNRNLNRYGLKQFLKRLETRCVRTGTQFLQIGRYEPTSKTCHVCGYVRPTLDLKVRKWTCPKCHTHHDRDLNAAINIKTLGQRMQQTLPDADGEVLTVEQTARPCCEPVKSDAMETKPIRKKQRCTPPPQEGKEQGISRLAVKRAEQREMTATEFLKIIQPVIKTDKVCGITELTTVQVGSVRNSLSVQWRRKMMAEKCEALRKELLDVLTRKLPSIPGVSPEVYAERFNTEMKGWLYHQQICRDEPGLSFPVTKGNSLRWHLYVNRLIRNLQSIKIII